MTRNLVTVGVVAALLIAGLIASTGPASAQSTSGALAGTVRSEDGAAVEGAVVQAHSASSGTLRTGVTDDRGRYRIDLLSPGQWTVVARLVDGGLSTTRTVGMALQQTIRLDFTVSAGPSERVTVTAERPLVDRKKTAGQLRVQADEADALPLSGRVFTDLALLDSSVRQAAPGNYFGERGAVFVVNGQSGRSNSFLVDGLDNNDQVSGTSQNSFFSQQVIQEFVLLTHQYSAEFGRASGGLMNVVTKKGTNEPTWDAFIQGTSADWNRSGDFVDGLPESGSSLDSVRRFQVGATVGGPFRKDRAFYFVAFEHQESDDVVPYTGVDREGLDGGRFIAPSDDDNLFIRTDFNLSDTTNLMLRLSADDRTNAGVNVGGIFTPEAGFRIEEQDFQFAGTLNRIIAPHILSETRFLAATSEFDQTANSSRPGVSRPSGIFGGNNLNRQIRDEQRFQLVQNVTWMRGQHTVKFGLDVTHSVTDIEAAFNPNGNFIYDYDLAFEAGDCGTGTTASVAPGHFPNGDVPGCEGVIGVDDDGDGRVDETTNIFSYPLVFALIDGQPKSTLRDTRLGIFAQDRWEVGDRWLLDYGLRYDVGTYELPGDARVDSVVPNGGAGRDTDNLAPRFGFTFTPKPGGKSLIRGGAGVFYDKLVLAFPAVAAITSGTQIGLFFPQGFAFETTEEDIEERGIDAIRSELIFADQLTLRFSTGTELETPYTVQYNLGMERTIGRHAAFGVNVVRSQGYKLPLMKDLNPVSGLIRVGVNCNAANIDPDLEVGLPCHLADPAKGSIAALVTEGESWYTGLDLNWNWKRDASWVRASYTWSKAEDIGFDPLKGGIALPPDSGDIGGERGRSDGDREHRFVLSGHTNFFWGLHASAVMQLSSGVPFNVTTGQDDNVDGILSDRPAGVDRNDGADTPRDAIDAIRDQPVVPLGNYGRLEEPSFFQVDLRVTKPIVFGEGKGQGQLFVQIFNLLDTDNEGLVEGRAISPNFGRTISLAGPPRTLEVGLRIGY